MHMQQFIDYLLKWPAGKIMSYMLKPGLRFIIFYITL